MIEKPKKSPTDNTTYRPICLIDFMAKLMERLITKRLETKINKNGGLSERPFGFRKGRSTIHALESVKRYAEDIRSTACNTESYVYW